MDYAFQGWSGEDGTIDTKTGWKEVNEVVENFIRENPTETTSSQVKRKNMKVKFFGENVAYLIWDEYSLNKISNKYSYAKETRIMEKIDGKWKIVSVSAFFDHKKLIHADSLQ